MKRLPKHLLISLITFFVGVIAVSIWFFSNQKFFRTPKSEITIVAEAPLVEGSTEEKISPVEVSTEAVKKEDAFTSPLDKALIGDQKITYKGYTIIKNCLDSEDDYKYCTLKIKKGEKLLGEFVTDYGLENWLQYGFFNFLGGKDKQLIVHTYSGGGHCCSDYVIYDLKPIFRVIYDSRKFDNDIGNELTPVDINGDGVFEFTQDVMAFDYMAPGGHATSTFPPAVFAFDQQKNYYELANKKFPRFVLGKLKRNSAALDEWVKDCAKNGTHITQEEVDEISIRETFLYLIYAGRKEEGWKIFDENYNFQFRDKFKLEFRETFLKDITYKSIYGR